MLSISMPVWSLCPLRSPCSAPEESRIQDPHGGSTASPPGQVLGPCLYAGCGFYKITLVEDGQVKDGMCGIRFIGEALNSIAGSLQQMLTINAAKEMREGSSPIFGGSAPAPDRI